MAKTEVNGSVELRKFGTIPNILDLPDLIAIQKTSFGWFRRVGLHELFEEISPILDFTGKNLELHFEVPEDPFDVVKYTEAECRDQDRTYQAPLRVTARLHNKQTGEIKEMSVFMGDFPLMTEKGTFIYNGAERVVVSQLVRSPGAYFTAEIDSATDRRLFAAKLIPNRGAWLEFDTSAKNIISVKVDRKRKIPVTTLLRALGWGTDEEIYELFADVDTDPEHRYIESTIGVGNVRHDQATTHEEGLIDVYHRLRPGDPATKENARSLLNQLLFNFRRYDLGRVGRYKLDKRLGVKSEEDERTLRREDLLELVREIVRLNATQGRPDEIDHLGNRRVRPVGELLQNQFRTGLLRMERVIKERMTIQDAAEATPAVLINTRPVMAAVKEFFGGSQLSQFMDQTNPLSELAHKRRLSAMGPGGLSRERAGFDVRDVHFSHYGRVCPIETPEGPNIGLISSLASYAKVNEYGFISTPYRVVKKSVESKNAQQALGRELRERIKDKNGKALGLKSQDGKVLGRKGSKVTNELVQQLKSLKGPEATVLEVKPFVTDKIEYFTADEEEKYVIAQANANLGDDGSILDERVAIRTGPDFHEGHREEVDLIDVSPQQMVSIPTAMIPFLEHDDANRALMGSNMQRQAVPLLEPEAPLVSTGIEQRAALDSGHVVSYDGDTVGTVIKAVAGEIIIKDKANKEHSYRLRSFERSNQGTCINHRALVRRDDKVSPGDLLADSSSTDGGLLALGRNIVCAFMFWEGYNFEDAIVISENLVTKDVYTSIHIEKFEVDARDTKLGPEEITRDIPNVADEALRNLDEDGIVYVGADVGPDDIIVGKITPKGETELTGEDRLLRAIFGRDAREVKDTSKHVPAGDAGTVIDVRQFSREDGTDLAAGVNHVVRVSIASKRKITEGDKMAGRHGNKGVISLVLPQEDMPYLEDGTPVDIVLNPLGAASRMNVGQLLEMHAGAAAKELGIRVVSPVFDSATESEVEGLLEEAGLRTDGKAILYDGRTGDPFDEPVVVGQMYMLKLAHLVEDKIHGRSTGPYSLITQQPLGGKAQMGGQRFGEMEVWALQAYGAAHVLQEMLTVKSDDVLGRVKTYEAIVKGEMILDPGVPESFRVLVKELQSLGLAVDVLNSSDEEISIASDASQEYLPDLDGINIEGREYKL
jgi:DNA-directed RNA polymerase subunit beta